jgi:superfamily II DNA/RNA helicase
MSPTRELAQQIDQQVEGFAYFMPISSVAIYGGNDGIRFEQERKGLKLGADIIIATPGRLISHLATGNIDLSHVAFFVLDEADRMLDMGFYDDIMKIVKMLPEERQTIMFSATMPENIQKLAHNILHDPVEVKIAVSKPADKIKQTAYMCHENMKPKIMAYILKDNSHDKIIIFASSKQKVKELYAEYIRKGFNVGEIHSDLLQSEREKIMYDFKNNHIKILIATDIISRGIDIDDIQLVINYDVPRDPEDYVHRIGRTARANRTGEAITLVSSKDYHNLVKIEKLIEKEIDKPDLFEGCGEKLDINKLRQDHKAANKKGKRGNNSSEKKHKKPRRHNQHSKKRSNEPSN